MTRPELFFGIINLAANQWLLPANSVAKIALPTVSSLRSSPAASEEAVVIFLRTGTVASSAASPPAPTRAHTPRSVADPGPQARPGGFLCSHSTGVLLRPGAPPERLPQPPRDPSPSPLPFVPALSSSTSGGHCSEELTVPRSRFWVLHAVPAHCPVLPCVHPNIRCRCPPFRGWFEHAFPESPLTPSRGRPALSPAPVPCPCHGRLALQWFT